MEGLKKDILYLDMPFLPFTDPEKWTFLKIPFPGEGMYAYKQQSQVDK